MAVLPFSGVAAGDADTSSAVTLTSGDRLSSRPVSGVSVSVGLFLPAPVQVTGAPGAASATITRRSPTATIRRR